MPLETKNIVSFDNIVIEKWRVKTTKEGRKIINDQRQTKIEIWPWKSGVSIQWEKELPDGIFHGHKGWRSAGTGEKMSLYWEEYSN